MDSRRMCPHCRAFITDRDRVCPYCNESVAPRAVETRNPTAILGGLIPHAQFNTVLLMVINFALYVATSIYAMKSGRGDAMNLDGQTLVDFGAKYGPAIAQGQWWRLVTAGFLHGGLIHILMNSWVLFDLGAQVEEISGAARMWVIYLVSSIIGFYCSDLWKPMAPSVGASAGICGLLGALIAIGMRHQSAAGRQMRDFYVRWMIYLLIFSLFGNTDMAAHIGGLAGGFCIAWIAGDSRFSAPGVERLWKIASWCCVIITAVSFLKMYLWFRIASQ